MRSARYAARIARSRAQTSREPIGTTEAAAIAWLVLRCAATHSRGDLAILTERAASIAKPRSMQKARLRFSRAFHGSVSGLTEGPLDLGGFVAS
jgi:hypothetical protein